MLAPHAAITAAHQPRIADIALGPDQTYGQLHFNSALTARVTPVPEPAALAMLATGSACLAHAHERGAHRVTLHGVDRLVTSWHHLVAVLVAKWTRDHEIP